MLRRSYRELRNSIGDPARTLANEAVARSVAGLLAEMRPGSIGTYLATDGELDPLPIRRLVEPLGWRFHLPVIGPERVMKFRPWDDSTRLAPNSFGIPEPEDTTGEVNPSQLLVVLMPCVAVDQSGHRLGMGGGYYDRAFSASNGDQVYDQPASTPRLLAIAFEVQLAEHLPVQPWDVAADSVVTESRVIHTRRP